MESEEDINKETQVGRSVSGRGGSYKSHTSKYSTAIGSSDSIARGSQGRSGLTGTGGLYTGYLSNSGPARGSNGQQVIKMFPIILTLVTKWAKNLWKYAQNWVGLINYA